MAKLNKFAQLYKQKVIYIYETPLAMDELSNYFDPKTVWIDVTNMPNVEVGYIQGVDESGNFVLKSPTSVSQEENYMTPDEIYYTIYYNIKLQREKYMNKIVRKKAFLDIDEPLRYSAYNTEVDDEIKAVGQKIIDYMVNTNKKIESYLKEKNYTEQKITAEYLNKPFEDVIKEIGLNKFSI